MTTPPTADAADVSVLPANEPPLLERVQALRYQVFVGELGLPLPGADHDRRLLKEPLDAPGRNFIALRGDDAVGSVRVNVVADGSAEAYVAAYELSDLGAGFESRTAIVTRLIRRGETGAGPLLNKLVGEILAIVADRKLRYIAVGAPAELASFYLSMGFAPFRDEIISPSGAPRAVLLLDVEDPRHKARKSLIGWLYPALFRDR